MPSEIALLSEALTRLGGDLEALGRAWARVMPSVVLVPAFGLRALPVPARTVMGLAFAACVLPAVGPLPAGGPLPWPAALLLEVARGLPVAVAAAVPLWAATMAGGLLDALRGSQEMVSAPTVEGRATPLGVPLSLLASAIFLGTGGPARVVAALAQRAPEGHPIAAAAENVAGGITLAVALGGPLLAASVIVEVASALIARAASPAQVHALLAPIRAIAALAVLGLVFERLASALARVIEASP
ncbi:MAG TPA: flagellar biosynthetic protein FliR [Polyangiaceae bacterium]|jgi:type III secretory pathway component EscT